MFKKNKLEFEEQIRQAAELLNMGIVFNEDDMDRSYLIEKGKEDTLLRRVPAYLAIIRARQMKTQVDKQENIVKKKRSGKNIDISMIEMEEKTNG